MNENFWAYSFNERELQTTIENLEKSIERMLDVETLLFNSALNTDYLYNHFCGDESSYNSLEDVIKEIHEAQTMAKEINSKLVRTQDTMRKIKVD